MHSEFLTVQRRSAIADYCKCLLAHYADLEEERRREVGGEKDSHARQPLLLTTAAESWARLEDALSLCLSLLAWLWSLGGSLVWQVAC